MTTEEFADKYRLHTRLDEYGDKIIPGKRGMLYLDGDNVCLMAIDRKPANVSRWRALGGSLWMGDISPNAQGVPVQDVKVEGITNVKAAIRMAGIKHIRVMSEAQTAVLDRARALLPPPGQRTPAGAGSLAGGGVVPKSHPGEGSP